MSQRVYDAAAREKLTKWLGGEKKDFKAATDLLVSENREGNTKIYLDNINYYY